MSIEKLKQFIILELKDKLSENLSYHGLPHTLHVLEICQQYIVRMNLSSADAYLLSTSALLHDTGFMFTYENHEVESIKYARKILPQWDYTEGQIDKIAGMILATRIPQNPENILEQIIGDADLDYLGTDSFYKIGDYLYRELLAFNRISNEEEWDRLQIRFLRNHQFHTQYAIEHREPVKQKYLKEILNKWGWK